MCFFIRRDFALILFAGIIHPLLNAHHAAQFFIKTGQMIRNDIIDVIAVKQCFKMPVIDRYDNVSCRNGEHIKHTQGLLIRQALYITKSKGDVSI